MIVNENNIKPDAYGRDHFRMLLKFLNIISVKGCYKWPPFPRAQGFFCDFIYIL